MRKPLTLWLLNRIVHWDVPYLVNQLSDRYDVTLGRRVLAERQHGACHDRGTQTVALHPTVDPLDGYI